MKFEGRVWKFGNNVDTDVMTPGKYMNLPMDEMKKHVFEPVNKRFADEVEEGDIIVAGENFGCGSSRETAPSAIKTSGIAAVVAESFARIFFRNSIAIGLPVAVCPGVADHYQTGDRIKVNMEEWKVTNKKELVLQPLPKFVKEILDKGGIMNTL